MINSYLNTLNSNDNIWLDETFHIWKIIRYFDYQEIIYEYQISHLTFHYKTKKLFFSRVFQTFTKGTLDNICFSRCMKYTLQHFDDQYVYKTHNCIFNKGGILFLCIIKNHIFINEDEIPIPFTIEDIKKQVKDHDGFTITYYSNKAMPEGLKIIDSVVYDNK